VTTIAERWRDIDARVTAACALAKRARDSVTLVAVSKTHPASAVREAFAAGVRDFGENYAQELATKRAELGELSRELRWHFIGRLQRNKVKLVAGHVALIHAVDSAALAYEIAARGPGQAVALAVNLGGEATKSGVAREGALALAREVAAIDGVRLVGLMTMPPPSDDPEANRPAFQALAELRSELAAALALELPVLSMGMSGDFEAAIACGATHVRIGTAIFGERVLAGG
jgi:hypothetical protein